jgi:hypothetical protein
MANASMSPGHNGMVGSAIMSRLADEGCQILAARPTCGRCRTAVALSFMLMGAYMRDAPPGRCREAELLLLNVG